MALDGAILFCCPVFCVTTPSNQSCAVLSDTRRVFVNGILGDMRGKCR